MFRPMIFWSAVLAFDVAFFALDVFATWWAFHHGGVILHWSTLFILTLWMANRVAVSTGDWLDAHDRAHRMLRLKMQIKAWEDYHNDR